MLENIHICKVDVPKANIAIIITPTFQWYMVRCGSKNEHQKGRHVFRSDRNMLTILDSIVNMIGPPIQPLNEHGNFHFDNGCHVHMTSKNHEANDLDWDLALIACFLFCEKWMQ